MIACPRAEALTALDTRTLFAQQSSNTYATVASSKHAKACVTGPGCHCVHDPQNCTKENNAKDSSASSVRGTTAQATSKGETGQAMTKQAAYLSPRRTQSCPEMPLLACSLGAVDPKPGQGGHPYQPQGSHAVHLLYLPNECTSNC